MIVVTGAAGFSGQGVTRALKRAGQPVRVLVKRRMQLGIASGAM